MRLYAAMDLHCNNSVLTILDERDRVAHERRLPNELPRILTELARKPRICRRHCPPLKWTRQGTNGFLGPRTEGRGADSGSPEP